MTMVKDKINSMPVKTAQIIHATWAVQALRTSVELKVFDQLEKGPQDAAAIAAAIKADTRAVAVFLNAIVSMGLMQKTGNKYSLTDEASTYLVSTSTLFVGNYLHMTEEKEKEWQQLPEVIRSGKSADQVNEDKRAEEFFPALAEMIFPMNFATGQRVVEEIKVPQLPPSARILDVAAGAGTWSIPMALANRSLHIDALDFPATLAVTKKYATKYGVADRYGYISGNWRDVQWQRDAYEVVILGHILHSEGERLSKELVERCFAALKPAGKLVIAEMIANDDRSGPPFAMLFGINMLMKTKEGCVFTESQLSEILTSAGFVRPYRMAVEELPFSPIMIAEKPG